MSREIWIYRDVPVINGYAQAAPNLEAEKTGTPADTAITQLEAQMIFDVDPEQSILLGTSKVTRNGVLKGKQNWIRLPGITPDGSYTDMSGDSINPMDVIRQ